MLGKQAVTTSPTTLSERNEFFELPTQKSFTEMGGEWLSKNMPFETGLAGIGRTVGEIGLAGFSFLEGISRFGIYGAGYLTNNPDWIEKGSAFVPSGLGAGIGLGGKQFLGSSDVDVSLGFMDVRLGSQKDIEFVKKHPTFGLTSALLDVWAFKGMVDLGVKGLTKTKNILSKPTTFISSENIKVRTPEINMPFKRMRPFNEEIKFKVPDNKQIQTMKSPTLTLLEETRIGTTPEIEKLFKKLPSWREQTKIKSPEIKGGIETKSGQGTIQIMRTDLKQVKKLKLEQISSPKLKTIQLPKLKQTQLTKPIQLTEPKQINKQLQIMKPIQLSKQIQLMKPIQLLKQKQIQLTKPIQLNKQIQLTKQVQIMKQPQLSKQVQIMKPIQLNKTVQAMKQPQLIKQSQIFQRPQSFKQTQLTKQLQLTKQIQLTKQTQILKTPSLTKLKIPTPTKNPPRKLYPFKLLSDNVKGKQKRRGLNEFNIKKYKIKRPAKFFFGIGKN